MAIGAFPAAKLGGLLLRQISKPLANFIMARAKTHPVFRKYVCMPPAQMYNWMEVKMKMWILNLGKPVNIPVLNEQMAIELGANLLGEGIIFSIAAGILVYEYNRSSRKEAAKEAAKEKEMEDLITDVKEIAIILEEQRTQIRELFRYMGHLDTTVQKKPHILTIPDKPKVENEDGPHDGPPPSPPTITAPSTREVKEVAKLSLLEKAIDIIELEFLRGNDVRREAGILTTALRHLYGDVYKLPPLC